MRELQEQVRRALTGPVCSIATPFRPDGKIDYPAVAQMIDFQVTAGFGMIFLTPGNSHYVCMRDHEVTEMCRFCVEHTAKRVPVCVCCFNYSTRDAVAFAEYAHGCGAELVLPLPPVWANGVTPEELTGYYLRVAEKSPLMLIYSPLPQTRDASLHLEQVFRRAPGRVLAIKDDFCTPSAREMTAAYGERCAVFAGGQKQNFLNIKPYGATGFLSTIGMFRPEITWDFWRAVTGGNEKEAARIVTEIDTPFFDLLVSLPGSFDAGIHAIMEMYGFGCRSRRPPYHTLTEAELEQFRAALAPLGLLP